MCIDAGGSESQHLVDGGLLSRAEELRQVRAAFRRAAQTAPAIAQNTLNDLDGVLERLALSGADPGWIATIRDEAQNGLDLTQTR